MFNKLQELRARKEDREGGFTLIELLVVVVIIGILIAIAIPLYLNYQKGAHDKSAQSDLRSAVSTLQQCYTDAANVYPINVAGTEYAASFTLDCSGTPEKVNLSSGTHLVYKSDATGSSFTLAAWNTGGHKSTSADAYTYDSTAGGSIQ